ncbi:DUF2127 domain-containing protein [Paraburkholderia tagetis]|uniref:DUF2127 domain-containing protein n=1 Tax=Paraburkholderia tagetis TaxID=2913261 RepID=A0A9X1RXR4_9BURK|nr:DUF2127 domain-containing protein [Paraburkholderia tagetis]MCG5076713.1 DUF2127 domain-containing protein [Paraburkholderia tagetis]
MKTTGEVRVMGLNRMLDEKRLHLMFEVSLWFKAVFALSEIVAGVATYFVPQRFLLTLVIWVTRDEFAEDPHDLVATFLLHSVQHLSIGAQKFAAIYLLAHGVIKLWLIAGLLRERLCYYPVSMAVFGLFVIYQLYRFSFTHSFWLLLVTALDVAILALTWHEYHYLRNERKAALYHS